ncbi:MAG: glycosyltransferase family 8 protein [Halocynthiibacter sp.]
MSDTRLQVVYCTDEGYAEPSLTSAFSLLEKASCGIDLTIMAPESSPIDWSRFERMVAGFPNATFTKCLVPADRLAAIKTSVPHISPATFLRLLLPEFMSGRVLYLDGDTGVMGDVAPLASLDMGHNHVAAVMDAVLDRYMAYVDANATRKDKRWHRYRDFLALKRSEIQSEDLSHYFNAGVIFIDLDKIKADPDICAKFGDVKSAASLHYMDQDWLNRIFAKSTYLLPPNWNLFAKVDRLIVPPMPNDRRAPYLAAKKDPIIIHFIGPHKPWKPWRLSQFLTGFGFVRHYKATQKRLTDHLGKQNS